MDRGSNHRHRGFLYVEAESDSLQSLGRLDVVPYFHHFLRLGGTVDIDVVDLLSLQDDGEGAGDLPVSE